MKKYTFHTTGLNNTKNNNSTDYSKVLDNIISANILKANPYFAEFETNVPKNTKEINIDIEIQKTPTYTFEDDQYEGILKAIDFFYSDMMGKKNYDFLLPDGTPVKKFHDEIQIGYELIPLNSFTKKVYEYLKNMNKTKIVEFYVNMPKKYKKDINILIA